MDSTKTKPKNKICDKFITEYERGLLALAFRHSDLLAELQQKITAKYFLKSEHRVIYLALCTLSKDPRVTRIDLESLCIECNKLGFLDTGVSTEYLVILTGCGYDKENFDFYYERVRNSYLKAVLTKKLIVSHDLVIKNAEDLEDNLTADKMISDINIELASLLSGVDSLESKAIEVGNYIDEFLQKTTDNSCQVRGLRTGFESLDKAINGLIDGTLTIFAGKAGEGKSTVLLNIANYVAIDSDEPKPVLVISTEMYTDEDVSRLLAMRTLIDERTIINGLAYQNPDLKPLIDNEATKIKKTKLLHLYLPDFNASQVCNIIYQYKIKYDIGLAIFDYIKMDTVSDSVGGGNRLREDQILGDLTTALKNMAGKLRIPIVAACQVNTRTGLIADSDRLIRYCNNLIYFQNKSIDELQQQDYFKHGTHWFIVKKARGGGQGKIPVRFWKKCLKLQEAEVYEEEVDEQTNSFVLTTPSEYTDMKNASFSMEAITNLVDTDTNPYEDSEEDDTPFNI